MIAPQIDPEYQALAARVLTDPGASPTLTDLMRHRLAGEPVSFVAESRLLAAWVAQRRSSPTTHKDMP